LKLFQLSIYLVKSVCASIRFKQRVDFGYILLLLFCMLRFDWLVLCSWLLRLRYNFLLRSFLLTLLQLWFVEVPLRGRCGQSVAHLTNRIVEFFRLQATATLQTLEAILQIEFLLVYCESGFRRS
jgi:hypothetical protein